MLIETQLINIGVLEYVEFSPLMYIYSYPLPFLMFWLQIIVKLIEGSSINFIESLFFIIIPIVLKMIASASFDASKLQGTFGKKITSSYVVNKDESKIKYLKSLGRNVLKYAFLMIFPPLAIFRLHDLITGTKVVSKESNA